MKKLFVFAGVLALLTGVLVLTACGGGGRDEALLGNWSWELTGDTKTFNDDGTGTRTFFGEPDPFTWSTNGDRLNINRDSAARGETRNERWTYTISGNTLTIESRQEDLTMVYIRQP